LPSDIDFVSLIRPAVCPLQLLTPARCPRRRVLLTDYYAFPPPFSCPCVCYRPRSFHFPRFVCDCVSRSNWSFVSVPERTLFGQSRPRKLTCMVASIELVIEPSALFQTQYYGIFLREGAERVCFRMPFGGCDFAFFGEPIRRVGIKDFRPSCLLFLVLAWPLFLLLLHDFLMLFPDMHLGPPNGQVGPRLRAPARLISFRPL